MSALDLPAASTSRAYSQGGASTSTSAASGGEMQMDEMHHEQQADEGTSEICRHTVGNYCEFSCAVTVPNWTT